MNLEKEGLPFYMRAARRGKRRSATFQNSWPRTFLVLHPALAVLVLPKFFHPFTRYIPMAELLNNQDIKAWLKKLPEWDQDKKHIERVFEFDDFTGAIDFVNQVAEIAEEEEHHPDIDVRYNKVRIGLSTHREGGLTELDFELAERIETLVE